MAVSAVSGLRGELVLPGDKSISHRALMLGAIANGRTEITNFLNTGDCLSTIGVLRALGIEVAGVGTKNVIVHGKGLFGFKQPSTILDAGNSATTARLISGLLAGQAGPAIWRSLECVVDGDESLRTRPMNRIIAPLTAMGANINASAGDKLPLTIIGAELTGITYDTPVASAQIKSAVLLAGILASGLTTVTEPYLSRDHTERMLEVMGANISSHGKAITVKGGTSLTGAKISVPADISSAAFFIVAAILTKRSRLVMPQVGMNSARIGLLDVLKDMGANVTYDKMTIKNKETRADIIAESGDLRAVSVGPDVIPRLIDEIPILAVAATQAEGKTVISGAEELRVKESDRLAAIATNLKSMGAKVRETEDGLVIKGSTPLRGAAVKTYGDHRMAMAMIVAGLIADGETVIDDADCIDVSFPGFEEMLKSVAF